MKYGIIGLLILIAQIWAIIKIVKSGGTDGEKVLWVVLVVIIPVIGIILWYIMGPGDKSLNFR